MTNLNRRGSLSATSIDATCDENVFTDEVSYQKNVSLVDINLE